MLYELTYTFFSFFERQVKREGKRGRETLMRERNINWLPPYMPRPGSKPTTQAHALTWNQTGDLLVCGMMPNQLSHTGQGHTHIIF